VAVLLAIATASHSRPLPDDLGRTVDLQAPPRRIVSLAPSNTELLYALGLGPRVVGVTRYCNWPLAAQSLPQVADYSSLSAEAVAGLRPDLVLAARGNDPEGLETLRRTGIAVFALDIQSIRQLLAAVQRVGALCAVEDSAARLDAALRQRLERVQARVQGRPRVRVLWAYWGEPIFTAGDSTLIDDVLTLAGGDNLGRQAPGAWPQVSLETLVAWAPEVVVTSAHQGGPEALAAEVERLRQTPGWQSVPAVRQGRVCSVDGDLLNRPGPRVLDALEQVAAFLHPETAGQP
jgi:iron complex transport system substrate-binding protein